MSTQPTTTTALPPQPHYIVPGTGAGEEAEAEAEEDKGRGGGAGAKDMRTRFLPVVNVVKISV